jgi:hypothetical protein
MLSTIAGKRAREDADTVGTSVKKRIKKPKVVVASTYTSTHKKVSIEVYDALLSEKYGILLLDDELLRRMTADKDILVDSLLKKITNRSSESLYAHLFTRDHAKTIVDKKIVHLTPKVPKLLRPKMGRPKITRQ